MTILYNDTGFIFTEIKSLDQHPKTSSTFDNDLKILFTDVASVNNKHYNEDASYEEFLPLIIDVLPNDLEALKKLYEKIIHKYPWSESMLSEAEKNQPSVKRAYFLAQAIVKKSEDLKSVDKIPVVNKTTLECLKQKEQERTELLMKELQRVLVEENNYAQCNRATESLKRLIKEYDEHLQNAREENTQDKLLNAKLDIVKKLQEVFETTPETAKEVLTQLQSFQCILEKNQDTLKECRDTCFQKFLKAVGFILSLALFWFVDMEDLGIFSVNGTRASTFPGFIYNSFTTVKGNYFFKRANLNHDYELDTKSWFCKENTIIVKAENGKLRYAFKSLTTGDLIHGNTDIDAPTPLTDESVKIYKKDILKLMQASGHVYNLVLLEDSINPSRECNFS
jgi:hypothetical protein